MTHARRVLTLGCSIGGGGGSNVARRLDRARVFCVQAEEPPSLLVSDCGGVILSSSSH